jgi:signal transduction histidine kinase
MSIARDRSRILTRVLAVTSLLVTVPVVLLSGFFLFHHQGALQEQLQIRAGSLAASIAGQCQSALLINDRAELDRIARRALSGGGDVAYVLVEAAGAVLASARRPDLRMEIPAAQGDCAGPAVRRIRPAGAAGALIEVTAPVTLQAGEGMDAIEGAGPGRLGRIRLAMSIESQQALFDSTFRQMGAIALLIVVCACALGYAQIRRLLRPLVELARAAKRLDGNYEGGLAVKEASGEVGDLLDSFNELAGQVSERTRQSSGQVQAKERALAELAEAQQRITGLSRQSGMAEVASSVLHNVGNVLNSVSVSTSIVAGKVRESRVDKLAAVVAWLREHEGGLDSYLRDDPKGSRLLPYLGNLSARFEQERESLLAELEQMARHVGHIKQIVATQQAYARVSGLNEPFSLAELADDAIRILEAGLTGRRIDLRRDYEQVPEMDSDKHRVLQILLNLLRNARQAIDEAGRPDQRLIRVRIRRHGRDRVRLEVKDSGVGLSQQNLTRIFTHGFTTKQGGHGFGLHSGALAARELGGALWAESEGPGQGATFTLELPLDVSGRSERETVNATVTAN